MEVGCHFLQAHPDPVALGVEIIQVAPETEHGSAGVNDHRPDIRCLAGIDRRLEQFVRQREIDRVTGFRAVQRDPGNPIRHRVENGLVSHDLSPFAS